MKVMDLLGGQEGLFDVAINPDRPLQARWRDDLLGGLMVVEADGYRLDPTPWKEQLYLPLHPQAGVKKDEVKLVALPYYAWGHRGYSGMRVWITRAA